METFTHGEVNHNDIYSKTKEGSETDIDTDIEGKQSLS